MKKHRKAAKSSKLIDNYKERLIQVLDEEQQVWWSDNLEVSQSVISSGWKKDSLPRSDNLLRICEIKGISANWMLFGIGPKHIEDVDEKNISDVQKRSDVTQRRIMQQSEEILELKEKIKGLKRALSLSKLSNLVKYDAKISNRSDSDIFNDNILPLLALSKSIQEVMFKVFEEFSEKNMNNELFNEISQHLSDNLESNKYSVISTLKELDKKFGKH